MSRINLPFTQHSDDAGKPLINGQLHFYEVGTATLKDTFADASLTIPNSNPVLLSGSGREPNIYGSGTYRATLSDSEGSQIEERDNVGGDQFDGYGSDWVNTVTYDLMQVVISDGIYYKSVTSDNINKLPVANPSLWVAVGSSVTTTYTSSGSFNLSVGAVSADVEVQAAGGGSGGSGGTGAGFGAGGGGGSGAYSKRTYKASQLPNPVPYTIGASGTGGGVVTDGLSGGSSTFDTMVCNGGQGGATDLDRQAISGIGGQGGIGGTATGGDIDIDGSQGGSGFVFDANGIGARGADSQYGSGGIEGFNNLDGAAGTGFGAGGGAGSASTVTGRIGAAGRQGVIIITEHF